MVFGQPQFLPLLLLSALPLLIHLLALRQRRTVRFSMTRFLREVAHQTQGRRWLRELILLLLRTGALLLALMSLIRPYAIVLLPLPPAPTSIAIVLDNSLSLQSRTRTPSEGESQIDRSEIWFNRGLRLCEQAMRQFPFPVEVAIFAADNASRPICDFTDDRTKHLQALRQLRPTFKALDLSAALQAADFALSLRPTAVKRVAVITDLQSEPFRSLNFPKMRNPVTVVDVKPKSQFGNVRLTARLLLPLDPKTNEEVTVELKNMSDRPMDGAINARVGGKVFTRLEISLPSEGQKVISFPLPVWVLEASWEKGLVKVEVRWEANLDIFEWDDSVVFTFKSPKRLKVANLVNEGHRYVDAALKAVGVTPVGSFSLDNDVVIASAPSDPKSAERLAGWVRQGGKAIIVADNTTSPLWSTFGVSLHVYKSGQKERVQWVDESSPVLSGLGSSLQAVTTWLSINVKGANSNFKPLATLTDGTPLLGELRVGRGRCFLLTTPLNPKLSNLVHSPAFVPLIYRIVRFCAYGHWLSPKEAEAKPQAELGVSTVVPSSESDFRLPPQVKLAEKLKGMGGTVL
ncbi:MAG: BatA domain-containing protein, partial [Candidatus Fervidibacter sp.]|uniref:BatA domain-containing protein n=1 Tax=Candidatus Fervidibacter sp. TaxID=3100871 RepID=UPI0040497A0D